MKKHLLLLLICPALASSLLAQLIPQLDSQANTSASSVAPTQHLEATYNIASKQSKPMGSVTWVADLQNDTAPYLYKVTVTLQNTTDKVFGKWTLAPLFIGSVATKAKEVMIDDPNNPGKQVAAVAFDFDVSPEVQIVLPPTFKDGPAPGFAIFGGVLDQGTMDLAPHGNITFSYTYQLPASQQTIVAPFKFILSRGISYAVVPSVPDSSDSIVANS